MIIDIHAHIFPDKIALKAADSIEKFYEIVPMSGDGTVDTLLRFGDEAGIDKFVVHSVATTPAQVENINNFIISSVQAHPDRLIGFASIHPDYENIPSEVDRVIEAGLKGIKIHPDFQKFLLDEDKAMPLYEAIEGRLPLLVHTGDYRYEYSKPERMARVMDKFPKLEVIGAHFGGWSEWDDAARILADRGIYVDCSSSLYALTPERAAELIHIYGADHVFFGSDYPMWNPGEELKKFNKIALTDEERELILHKNLERLLKL